VLLFALVSARRPARRPHHRHGQESYGKANRGEWHRGQSSWSSSLSSSIRVVLVGKKAPRSLHSDKLLLATFQLDRGGWEARWFDSKRPQDSGSRTGKEEAARPFDSDELLVLAVQLEEGR
jgi:hypothetical protein